MIDLHAHTSESDGSLSPVDLIKLAVESGLEALAITDHDTFAGYDQAVPAARESSLELVCGIELSTKHQLQTVHLLGYFLHGAPTLEFRNWILKLQESRKERNHELLHKLQSCGFDLNIAEATSIARSQLGRPHIAELMLAKGYVSSLQHAFDDYLGENGKCYVARQEPLLTNAVAKIIAAGGIPSLAHPGRISSDLELIEYIVHQMQQTGLCALEVYHSEHGREQIAVYESLARELRIGITGGSDFHGSSKPGVKLGTGNKGDLSIPISVLYQLRAVHRKYAFPRQEQSPPQQI
ncbi:MAG TPA: PHP domain-containing protein [Candidatus Acidoferrales bacterium]|nr:PHP domain-containing protein [Candidatus Acidoferrales bacterium]